MQRRKQRSRLLLVGKMDGSDGIMLWIDDMADCVRKTKQFNQIMQWDVSGHACSLVFQRGSYGLDCSASYCIGSMHLLSLVGC